MFVPAAAADPALISFTKLLFPERTGKPDREIRFTLSEIAPASCIKGAKWVICQRLA